MTGLTIAIVIWIVAAATARVLENNKNQKRYQEILTHVTGIDKKLGGLLEDNYESPKAEAARRVYAAILVRGNDRHLHMVVADSINEAGEHARNTLGSSWLAEVVDYVDVWPPTEKVVYRNPTLKEQKEMGVQQGYYFLQMAKDKYAQDDQKEVMQSVIANYKKVYDL